MKKINAKLILFAIVLGSGIAAGTTSCSKDNDNGFEEPKGNIEAAVGTYKGKLEVTPTEPNQVHEWYDAIVSVSKESSDKLRIVAKTGEPYSFITPKVFTVETGAFFGENTQDIVSLSGSLEGYFHFYGSNKNIAVMTQKQSPSEKDFRFEGVKQ